MMKRAASIAVVLFACGGPTPEPKTTEPNAKPVATAIDAKPAPPPEVATADAGTDAAPVADEKLHVLEAGAEPKALRTYAFVANKVEKRILTVTQEQEHAGRGGSSLTLAMQIDFTPKKVEPKATHFELKVTKLELKQPGAPKAQRGEIDKGLRELTGLTGDFDVSPRGEVGEVSMHVDKKVQSQLGDSVAQGISQLAELLTPTFPETPIGVGAKWTRQQNTNETGVTASQKATYTLTEVSAESGVVDVDIEVNIPTQAVQRGAPPGTTFSAAGKGKYTYRVRFDRLATNVKGELVLEQHVEVVDASGRKQAVDQAQIAKHSIETPK